MMARRPFIGTQGIKEPTNEQFAKDTFEPFLRKSLTPVSGRVQMASCKPELLPRSWPSGL